MERTCPIRVRTEPRGWLPRSAEPAEPQRRDRHVVLEERAHGARVRRRPRLEAVCRRARVGAPRGDVVASSRPAERARHRERGRVAFFRGGRRGRVEAHREVDGRAVVPAGHARDSVEAPSAEAGSRRRRGHRPGHSGMETVYSDCGDSLEVGRLSGTDDFGADAGTRRPRATRKAVPGAPRGRGPRR